MVNYAIRSVPKGELDSMKSKVKIMQLFVLNVEIKKERRSPMVIKKVPFWFSPIKFSCILSSSFFLNFAEKSVEKEKKEGAMEVKNAQKKVKRNPYISK